MTPARSITLWAGTRDEALPEERVKKVAKKRRVVMETEVLDFLTKVATEPETLSDFLRNPDDVMSKHGLDEKAREALLSGDPLRVHSAISASAAADQKNAEQSMENARQVTKILSADPAVAQWLYSQFYLSMMMGLQGPAAPQSLDDAKGANDHG